MVNRSLLHYNAQTFMRFSMFRIILQSLLFLGHLLFYWTLVNFFGVHSPLRRRTLKIILGVLFLSLIPLQKREYLAKTESRSEAWRMVDMIFR
jgi:hypothetical protein